MDNDVTASSHGLSPIAFSDEEKMDQVAAQYRVAAHLAGALAELCSEMATCVHPRLVDIQGPRTARWMEILGDMLNGVDAVTDEDDWVNPVFERSHKMFPQSREFNEPRGLSASEQSSNCEAVTPISPDPTTGGKG